MTILGNKCVQNRQLLHQAMKLHVKNNIESDIQKPEVLDHILTIIVKQSVNFKHFTSFFF